MKPSTYAEPIDVLRRFLQPRAYQCGLNANVVYVSQGNVAFIQDQMNRAGFDYVQVKVMPG